MTRHRRHDCTARTFDWRSACGLLVLAVAPACAPDSPAADRVVEDTAWDTLWILRSDARDTLLMNPIEVHPFGDLLAVLDFGGRRVIALDASDGSLRWVAGGPGHGPEEFAAPNFLTEDRMGRLAVGDRGSGRITFISADGEIVRSIHPRDTPDVQGICAPEPGRLLVFTAGGSVPLVLVDSLGGHVAGIEWPWPDLRDAPVLVKQLSLTNVRDGPGCWAALSMGRGFAKFVGDAFDGVYRYIEDLPLPRVDTLVEVRDGAVARRTMTLVDRWSAAFRITATGDAFAVPFHGRTEHARRIIDFYDSRGRYLRSQVFPMAIQAAAFRGDVLYVLHTDGGFPAIVALRSR